MKKQFLRGLVLAFIALCSSAWGQMVCGDVPKKEGCVQIRLVGLQHDATNSVMSNLLVPWTTQAERAAKVENAPMTLHSQWVQGTAKSAGNHTYLMYVWKAKGLTTVPMSMQLSKAGDSLGSTPAEVVQNPPPVVIDRTVVKEDLGTPQVYRIRSTGENVGISFAWATLIENGAVILVCPEDQSLYPNRAANKGLWYTSAYLKYAQSKGWKYIQSVTLYPQPAPVATKAAAAQTVGDELVAPMFFAQAS